MDSRRRGKRKSPSQDIIFEVSDNDISADNSENDSDEPEAKICKIEGNSYLLQDNENSNLESIKETTKNAEISVIQEQENSATISEHISVSNSSSGNNSRDGSDIIVISEDNIDVVNDSEENNCSTSQTEFIQNSDCNSVISNDIIDITDENMVCLIEKEPSLLTHDNPDSTTDVLLEKQVIENNLEDGEVDESETQIPEDEIIDVVTKSPSLDAVDVKETEGDNENKPEPCICISFSSEKIAELYKFKFLKLIKQFVELEVEESDSLLLRIRRDTNLDPDDWVILDNITELEETKEFIQIEKPASPLLSSTEKSHIKKKKKKKVKKGKELFILDTNPSEDQNAVQYTKYLTKFHIDINEKMVDDEVVKISAQVCFNCEENHAIKDCPLPKNFAKINAARQKFKAQKVTARYHLEEDQKYDHLKPGKISDRLREALGLRKNQLPPFTYHMRKLGYPPGWLEEAKFIHSNLTMFDSDGNNLRDGTKKKAGLDVEKIIDYPGFNVPMDKNMKDEYRNYHVPPYSDMFNKQAMIDYFEKNFAKEQDDFEICDMDLDTSEQKQKITNPLIKDVKEIDSNMPSPSLVDLEKQKENLLAALEENSNPDSKLVEANSEDAETSSDQEKSKKDLGLIENVPIDQPLEVNTEKAEDVNASLLSPPLNSSLNCVKTSTFGTPILKSSSPYSKLPNPDNFMKDVSPIINFENLPNSTGKYEQMTGVLQKVRNTLKNRQNCNS